MSENDIEPEMNEEMDAADVPEEAATDDLPADFWSAGSGTDALSDPTPRGSENALERLGRPPFQRGEHVRGRFRLLGFLATVYDHVAEDVKAEEPGSSNSPPA